MSAPVTLSRDGEIAVIMVDNPPVNALKHAVRAGLAETIEAAAQDDSVKAVVLACAGRTFVAGADITEFGKPMQPPGLSEVIDRFDTCAKPIVAAIHGTALGGGLELALGCHYRIAAPTARLGLPEVKLGILPGAGGTQRLPRAIGAREALRMIVSGEPIAASKALHLGLVDALSEGDLVADAIAFACKVVAQGASLPRLRDREDKLAADRADLAAFDKQAMELTARSRGLHAPAACVKAVRAALSEPFEAGLKSERALFVELVNGEQSKAQRYLFFAEREAAKVPGVGKEVHPRTVERVAVIGAGTMGGGIAMSFANAGLPVTLVETSAEALARGLSTIERNYAGSVKRGSLAEADMTARFARITGTTDLEQVADADLIIEAVFEDMDIKRTLFSALDRIARPGAILATNTSYLDVNAIARITARPQDVLGMHFFSPANVMRLLEIVRAEATAPDVLATVLTLARRIGKVPVVVGVCHGFVGNRMLRARAIEGERLLLEGASPAEVDKAITDFGFPMGPFAMGDLAGLDVGWRMRKAQGARAVIADALCEAGRFGQKTGKGFYLYAQGSRKPEPDPEVDQLISETARAMGITRRAIDPQEIVERLIYPMINEGARILEEGIALRPGDIDVIWIYGYGWPVARGGPMFFADQAGLAMIRDRLAAHAEHSGDERLKPSPLLQQLAREGGTFSAYAAARSKG